MKKNNPVVIIILCAIILGCLFIYGYNYWQKSLGLQTYSPQVSTSGEQTAGD